MPLFEALKKRMHEIHEEDKQKSQARRNQQHYEQSVRTFEKRDLMQKEANARKEGYEKGRIERAKREGYAKANRPSLLGSLGQALVSGIPPPKRHDRTRRKKKGHRRSRERQSIYF